MFPALLYLQLTSLKNRTVMRFKRLKQPKYLIGAIVGGLYFYFYFFRWMFQGHVRHGPGNEPLYIIDPALTLSFGALMVGLMMLLAWVVPRKRAALTFTEAEIAFLFPAPVSRRTLIHFKLLKSQFTILFISLFFTLIFRRTGANIWIRAAGWWLVLMTLNLHYIGASFAVTRLMDRGITTWKRRVGILLLLLAAAIGVTVWAARSLPPLTPNELGNPSALMDYAKDVLVSGPVPYLLSPFLLLVRPYRAAGGVEFLHALWPAVLLLAVHYWWVVRSDVAFEEASVEASQKLAERVAHIRAGKSAHTAGLKLKGRRPPFNLAPSGFQPVALLWKNLLSAGQGFSKRVWFILIWLAIVMVFAMRGLAGNGDSLLPVVGGAAAMVGVWVILIGPQMVRQDLRQDIPLADLLKLYPLRGWQVVLGENPRARSHSHLHRMGAVDPGGGAVVAGPTERPGAWTRLRRRVGCGGGVAHAEPDLPADPQRGGGAVPRLVPDRQGRSARHRGDRSAAGFCHRAVPGVCHLVAAGGGGVQRGILRDQISDRWDVAGHTGGIRGRGGGAGCGGWVRHPVAGLALRTVRRVGRTDVMRAACCVKY